MDKIGFAAPSGFRKLWLILLLGSLSCCYGQIKPAADVNLPLEELDALKKIDAKLTIGWNHSVNPCSGKGGWNFTTRDDPSTDRQITRGLDCGDCNATTTTNLCHVVSILLKGQNLTGVLPGEFGELASLRILDLSRNYISGTIPAAAWASAPLRNISLLGNRLTGSIPEEIGRITTLLDLVLEDNLLSGTLPKALGKLTSLVRLLLSSNNFTGVLPRALGNLKNLTSLRIDGNGISGNIPDFIGNWTNLRRLDMQGTSLKGSFPSTFSSLVNLEELRISDFIGDGKFPPLQNIKSMRKLVLRNCSVSGNLPEYLAYLENLKILDLSFNKFTGEIPRALGHLTRFITYLYLNNNMLEGSIPDWILKSSRHMDVSYNTFTGTPAPFSQTSSTLNLVASYSSKQNDTINPYFRKNNLHCPGDAKNYKLFINCGGGKVNIGGNEYEEDSFTDGISTFYSSDSSRWAYSSTGDFVHSAQNFLTSNTTLLNITDPRLYASARLSASSLTYYGLCLHTGNYTVKLNFAEIMFTNDKTFSSVGRRIFDISIQGQLRKKDFNIAKEANGTGREIILIFNATVEGSTLEINLWWAGKGTNAIPWRSVYGPLICAISITPKFNPRQERNRLSVGAILGIVIASCVMILLIVIFLWLCCRKMFRDSNVLRGLDLQTSYYSLEQIKLATHNFDPRNKIGEGGFGPVYKGALPDGAVIAIKQLSSKSRQGNHEFVNEIGMISAVQHPNLVNLFGCCTEGNQLLLIYEYMENNSLSRALFGPEDMQLKLDWQRRYTICLGIARGLAYLHEDSILKIVHRDIKLSNILLDKDLNPKISDFGLAKLHEVDKSHISTRIAGTVGYMAPEYALRGYLTDKADVYSFGVVLLEIISGKNNATFLPTEMFMHLLDWAYVLKEEDRLLELLDRRLGSDYSKEEAQLLLNLIFDCTNKIPSLRPTMSGVVSMLEGKMYAEAPSGMHASTDIEELESCYIQRMSNDS